MRLGFHYHVPACVWGGAIHTPGYQGRFIEALAACCSRVVCFLHSPRETEKAHLDHRITAPNVEWVDIGLHASTPSRVLHARTFIAPARRRRDELDLMLIRGPSPLLPQMAATVRPLPRALLLVGNQVDGVNNLRQPRWRKELIRLWSHWNARAQKKAAAQALTFVNSRRLYEEFNGRISELHETRTTTLSEKDFFEREDTCGQRPIRLLYTGRLDRAKGLFEMVRALAILVNEGQDVVLNLVGWAEDGDKILEELLFDAQGRGLDGRVKYLGFKALGPELFQSYKEADIFVLASKAEGFPRTIWEAMAHSLPVVATAVGSIPQFTGGAAELVPPNDVAALAGAIRKVTSSGARRRHMIVNGRALAAEMTLEKQVSAMVNRMETWLRK
jgi:glycosyltransferase involved in cell wall biosynthesis